MCDCKREMTRAFQKYLERANPKELTEELLAHMPRKAKQILGRESLREIDLLGLPSVPTYFKRRLAYLNILTGVIDSGVISKARVYVGKLSAKEIRYYYNNIY